MYYFWGSCAFNPRKRLEYERDLFRGVSAMKSIYINLVPSPRLAIWVIVLHVSAASVGGLCSFNPTLQGVLIFSIAWSSWRTLQTVALLRARGAITALRVSSEGHLFVQARDGVWLDCELLPSSYVSSCLTILNLRDRRDRQKRHVVLCCGNANSTDVRHLRTWLRWGVGTS